MHTPTSRLIVGDSREELPLLPGDCVDSVVTDPPYDLTAGKRGGSGPRSVNRRAPQGPSMIGTGFMGLGWDASGIAFDPSFWAQVGRVMKPGANLLAFGSPRTWHRLACAVEDAGLEIVDQIAWIHAQGMPHGLDIAKALDRRRSCAPDAASLPQRDGWNTQLRPAFEPVLVARKPLEGTFADNAVAWGTGGFNVDACRIGGGDGALGRWPADVAFSHAPGCGPRSCAPGCPVAELDRQSGIRRSGANPTRRGSDIFRNVYGTFRGDPERTVTPARGAEEGGASRFFFVSKAPASERPVVEGVSHPTVKPLDLLRTLVRLSTPPGGVVLDPFAGSGTTVEAAILEGFGWIGVEREERYVPLVEARIARARGQRPL